MKDGCGLVSCKIKHQKSLRGEGCRPEEMVHAETSAICLALFVTSSPLSAQVVIDVAKIAIDTNSRLTKLRILTASRLNGFFHGKRGDKIVDTQELAESAGNVTECCTKNFDVLLMQEVESPLDRAIDRAT